MRPGSSVWALDTEQPTVAEEEVMEEAWMEEPEVQQEEVQEPRIEDPGTSGAQVSRSPSGLAGPGESATRLQPAAITQPTARLQLLPTDLGGWLCL